MQTTVDLKTFPVLTRTVETVRGKVEDYLKRMAEVGKPVTTITLFAGDYDQALNAINRHRNRGLGRDEPKPEPAQGMTWGGVPVLRGRKGD